MLPSASILCCVTREMARSVVRELGRTVLDASKMAAALHMNSTNKLTRCTFAMTACQLPTDLQRCVGSTVHTPTSSERMRGAQCNALSLSILQVVPSLFTSIGIHLILPRPLPFLPIVLSRSLVPFLPFLPTGASLSIVSQKITLIASRRGHWRWTVQGERQS